MAKRKPPLSQSTAETIDIPDKMPGRVAYGPTHDAVAKALAGKYGFNKGQIADAFGVTTKTVENWMYDFPSFFVAFQSGKDLFNGTLVEDALLKRALGYEYDEVKVEEVTITAKQKFDNKMREYKIPATKITTTTKTLSPDPSSIFFYLVNRSRQRWQSAQAKVDHNHQHGHSGEVSYNFEGLNREELLALESILTKLNPEGTGAAQTSAEAPQRPPALGRSI